MLGISLIEFFLKKVVLPGKQQPREERAMDLESDAMQVVSLSVL